MELNNVIEEDFARLNDKSIVSDTDFDRLIQQLFALFTSANETTTLQSSFDKRLVSSILTFLFECVKYDLDDVAIRAKLNDLNFSTKIRQDRLLDEYKRHLPVMQLKLQQKTIEHDRLLDVNWRLDLQVKTNFTDKLFEPIYILDWTKRLRYTSTIEHVQLTCSQANLQELVEKLKDAQSVLHQMQYQQQAKK